MSTFEYIVGIHTIVLGLATAYLLTTITDTVKYRKAIHHYWVHTMWCVVLQFLLLGWWYGLWRTLNNLSTISYAEFLREFVFTLALFMAVRFLIVDIERHQKIDLRIHFNQVRAPFFICLMIPYLLFFSMGWWDNVGTGTPIGDVVTMAVQIAIPIAGIFVKNERAQAAFVIGYGATYMIVELQQYGVGVG